MLVAPARRTAEAGFSLIEVTAALFIAALAASVVLLSLPEPDTPLDRAARQLAADLDRASEAAVIQGVTIGLRMDSRGYDFQRWRGGDWIAVPDFRVRDWPEGVRVTMTADSDEAEAETDMPRVRFDSTGMATPYDIRLRSDEAAYRIIAGLDGGVRLEAIDG